MYSLPLLLAFLGFEMPGRPKVVKLILGALVAHTILQPVFGKCGVDFSTPILQPTFVKCGFDFNPD